MKVIEFFYSSHSAFAYLGYDKMIEIAKASGRQIIHRPVYLNKVVAACHKDGFMKRSKAHYAYYFGREIDRWAQFREMPMGPGIPGNHSNDTTLANSVLIAAQESGLDVDRLAKAFLGGHWVDHLDLADKDKLTAIIDQSDMDAADLLAKAESPVVREIYAANTEEAIERSVFGSPTYVVDGDMFYGQDRLEMVERALKQPFDRNWA